MSKLRIYEYAKQVSMSSKEIIEILKRLNKNVGNHMSIVEESDINDIENYIKQLKNKSEQKNINKQTKPKVQNVQSNNNERNKINEASTTHTKSYKKEDNSINTQQRPYNQQSRTSQSSTQQRPNNQQSRTSQSSTQQRSNNQHPRTNQSSSQSKPVQGFNNQQKPVYKNEDLKKNLGKENKTENTMDSNNKGTQSTKEKPQKKFDKFSDTRDINGLRKNKSRRHNSRSNYVKKVNTEPPKTPSKITYKGEMTVSDLAKALKKEPSEIIKKLMFLGVMATINQELELDTITLIAEEYGATVEEKIERILEDFETIVEVDEEKDLKTRPPVVTIMGHVDHGKTTLLDTIRNAKVTEGEFGGITQHIGAYQVKVNDKKITFLDTPGHAAFTSMRARGAKITDITILVVAADDGVMPQTIEAINHAKAAGVPIIVAVNKMDKPTANPDRVKNELVEYELVPEDWGGSTIFVPISALKNEGIDELLEMVLLVAEVEELKANPSKRARGTVIESQLDKGRGSLATVLVQNGTLKIGDAIIVGNAYGRIRAMINDQGKRVRTAEPSMPVEITGMSEVPNAGDQFIVVEDDKTARVIAEKRHMKERQQTLKASNKITLDDLYKQIKEGIIKDLNLILKADVHGSVEALKGALEKIDIEGVQVRTVHTGVGAITESDVILAAASNAIIIGFNVRPQPNAKKTAEYENVDIRLHSIIYKAIEEIESALKGLLDPEYKEVVLGHAEVRQVIKVSKIGSIAGCYVIDGKIIRDKKARIIRDGIVIFEGEMNSLKRFKDDVKEVATNYECGITLEKYNDFNEGDIIEVFDMQKVERT
jgi:translation initiation factor IF-2